MGFGLNKRMDALRQFMLESLPQTEKPQRRFDHRLPGYRKGFTGKKLNFIINYDIKYRLGRDTENDEE